MQIWKTKPQLELMNSYNSKTIHGVLGIEFTAIGPDYLEASMPVDHRTHQPAGLLHGGASAVLAESLGSMASALAKDPQMNMVVGIEINASHLRGARDGSVYGRVKPVRLGRSLHVWEIQIRESEALDSPLICVSRLTVMLRS